MIMNFRVISIWSPAKTSLIRNYNKLSFHSRGNLQKTGDTCSSVLNSTLCIDSREQRLISLLESCSTMREITQIHSQIIRTGFEQNSYVVGRIISFCAVLQQGSMDYAVALFQQVQYPDGFLWNTMVRGFGRTNRANEAFLYYQMMREVRKATDSFTLTFLLKICCHLGTEKLGQQVHCCVIKQGLNSHVYVSNTIIHMYGMFRDIDSAKKVFIEISNVDLVSWNSLIAGYANCSLYKDVLMSFLIMQREGFKPDEATLVVVLSACSELGAIHFGQWVHQNFVLSVYGGSISVANSLIDMYSKRGVVDKALEVFGSMKEMNLVSWNSIIQGLAKHGQAEEAVKLFRRMEERKLEEPNDTTFVAVLYACSHGGLLEEGRRYFDSMIRDYGINPNIKHYGCMVDLLGRAGLLKEAYELIVNMPIDCNAVVWRTLLAACRLHGDVELGGLVKKHLEKLEPDHSSDYVLVSQMYAGSGHWNDVLRVREVMRNRAVEKPEPGSSLVNNFPQSVLS